MYSEGSKKPGCIEVVCGSMFSGKTEELIRRLRRAQFANQKIAIFKPAIDRRYSDVEVVSHDFHKIESTPVSSPSEILDLPGDVQVVGIDEAQFFRVIVAGLDTDFKGVPFGPIPMLMAVAEDVQKVHAICVRCGSLANYSHRLSKSDDLVLLGEKDVYEPLCRDCYLKAVAEEG